MWQGQGSCSASGSSRSRSKDGRWAWGVDTVNSFQLGLGLGLVCGSGRDCDWVGLFDYRSIPHQRDRRVLFPQNPGSLIKRRPSDAVQNTQHTSNRWHIQAHTRRYRTLRPKCSPSEVLLLWVPFATCCRKLLFRFTVTGLPFDDLLFSMSCS